MEEDFKISVEAQLRYLRRRMAELSEIESDGTVNFILAKKSGHQIKGNADTFELPHLTSLAKVLEEKADNKDEAGVSSAIRNLLNCMSEREAALPQTSAKI